MAKRSKPFQPCCVYDAMGYIRLLRIAAEQEKDVVRLIVWDTTRDHVHSYEIAVGQISEYGSGLNTRYVVAESNLVHEAARLRDRALRYGATPEAIRLLGLICPVKDKEAEEMAEKLKSKGGAAAKSSAKAPTKGDAEALKGAAKAAPVASGKGKATEAVERPKKPGNPAALEKARAARGENMEIERKKKLTLLEKNNPKRSGSRAFDIYGLYKTCKTVGAFLDAGGTMSDIRYDSGKNFIQVG